MLDADPPVIAHRHAVLLGDLFDVLDQFLAPLFGQLRNRNANHFTVVVRRQAEIGLEDRLLDLDHGAAVEGLNDQEPRLGGAQSGKLIERRRRAVVLDHDMVEQSRRSPAGPQLGQIPAKRAYRTVHFLLQLSENRVVHRFPPLTKVPIASPDTTLLILPFSIRLKTMIGKLLSMHSEIAVESITLSSRFNTSM